MSKKEIVELIKDYYKNNKMKLIYSILRFISMIFFLIGDIVFLYDVYKGKLTDTELVLSSLFNVLTLVMFICLTLFIMEINISELKHDIIDLSYENAMYHCENLLITKQNFNLESVIAGFMTKDYDKEKAIEIVEKAVKNYEELEELLSKIENESV